PARAHALLPSVKLIALLREPAARAYSQYQHSVKQGWETLPFEQALRAEAERLQGEEEKLLADPSYRSFAHQHQSYVARGRYLVQLERWATHYVWSQILVISSERFYTDPASALSTTFEFFGLDGADVGPFEIHNASAYAEAIDPQLLTNLRHAFREDNERLFSSLGDDLEWER
ncbi:MAG: sulfotransferase domain-containing protein, partial [Actinomycetota bacterium]